MGKRETGGRLGKEGECECQEGCDRSHMTQGYVSLTQASRQAGRAVGGGEHSVWPQCDGVMCTPYKDHTTGSAIKVPVVLLPV